MQKYSILLFMIILNESVYSAMLFNKFIKDNLEKFSLDKSNFVDFFKLKLSEIKSRVTHTNRNLNQAARLADLKSKFNIQTSKLFKLLISKFVSSKKIIFLSFQQDGVKEANMSNKNEINIYS